VRLLLGRTVKSIIFNCRIYPIVSAGFSCGSPCSRTRPQLPKRQGLAGRKCSSHGNLPTKNQQNKKMGGIITTLGIKKVQWQHYN
jgi:hypothetical protein